jgi:PAS domain S-box-containing protein
MASPTTRLGSWLPAAAGIALSVVHVRQVLVRTSVEGIFLEAAPPLLASLGLVVAGVWFVGRSPDPDTVVRVDRWLVVGALLALLVGLWTAGNFVLGGRPAEDLPFLISGNVTAGLLFGLLVGFYDVRARKRKEQLERTRSIARGERDRFAALFENVLNPVVYYEFDGDDPVFRAVNDAFEDAFGYSESAVRGRPVDDVIVPPERAEEAAGINERIREGDTIQRELKRLTAHGARDFLVSVVPVERGDRAAGFFIAIDITERKRRDRRLQVLNRVLRHDLRNAMNVILGYVDLLGTSPNATERAAGVIERRAEEMVSLSEKARTIEEALGVGETTDAEVTDLVPLLRRRLAAATTETPSLTVMTTFPDRALARVREPELFEAAIDNVVENAVEHAEGGDPHLDVTVEVDGVVTVRFADDGPGIPEEELSVLASDRETQLEHLSGLGLWLVNWVVENTDGEATFETTEGGSVVTLRLPRAETTTEEGVTSIDDAAVK